MSARRQITNDLAALCNLARTVAEARGNSKDGRVELACLGKLISAVAGAARAVAPPDPGGDVGGSVLGSDGWDDHGQDVEYEHVMPRKVGFRAGREGK